MDKALVLTLPDEPGMLLKVERVLASQGVSVTRASYNRVIDVHTAVLEVTGTKSGLAAAEQLLRAEDMLAGQGRVPKVRLIELSLEDRVGSLEPVLERIDSMGIDIAFIDVRTDALSMHVVLLGVEVLSASQFGALLSVVREVCPVRVVQRDLRYNVTDNSTFYLDFARGLARRLALARDEEQELLVNANRIVQNLIRQNRDPYKPFDYINQVGETLAFYRVPAAFRAACRVTHFETCGEARVTCIEPPVGSDTWVLEADAGLLCVDAGYSCCAEALVALLHELYPAWDNLRKALVLTHGDIDHMGAWQSFDEVYAVEDVRENFRLERRGLPGWREQNPLHLPYNRIGSLLSGYDPPDPGLIVRLDDGRLGSGPNVMSEGLLRRVGTLDFAPFAFEVWQGAGGHVRGETVLVDRSQHVCVSGDIFVNVHDQTKPQHAFNALAPFLMTSVDSNPDLERAERTSLFELMGNGCWQVLGGHGAPYEWVG